MRIGALVIAQETLAFFRSTVIENKKNLPVIVRGEMEVVHRLIPHRHLCARNTRAGGPSVGLAFDDDFRRRGPKIEAVDFLSLRDTDLDWKLSRKRNTLLREKLQSNTFEVVSDVGVAHRADSLVWLIHFSASIG